MNDQSEDDPAPVVVAVTRSGGFAGMRRRWRVDAHDDDAPRWRALIAECPWDEHTRPSPPTGADRFMWDIRARCAGEPEHEAVLGDAELTGPWRALIDAVRGDGER